MLVYLCYLLLFTVVLKSNQTLNLIPSLLKSTLLFSLFIFSLTEFLSLFMALNLLYVSLSWALFALFLVILLIKYKTGTISIFKSVKEKILFYYGSLVFKEKIMFWSLILFIFLLFIQGLLYPPNNWDSLTYHMSRIMYWLSNESVSFFPTHILRHLYQPPFAEYFILHLNLLNGNDYLSNSVQLFFLIHVLFAIYAILGLFKTPRLFKLLALLLVLTIPSVELQSTTTKNDIVCAFFIITAIYFSLKTIKKVSLKNYFFFGLTIGLAILTKGTAYIFLAPLLLCFGIAAVYKLFVVKDLRIIKYNLLAIITVLLLNGTHYSRNYAVSHSIMNVDELEAKAYSNDVMDCGFLFSNLIKNAGLHMGFPVRDPYDQLIRLVHKKMDISIDDKRLNYFATPYEGARNTTHEDYVPNTIHFFLSVVSFFILVIGSIKNPKKDKSALLIVCIIGAQILLFAGYLKWQPWHTRLHIPIFILSVISIVLAIQLSSWYRKLVLLCTPLLMLGFLFLILFNNLRPIITAGCTKDIQVDDTRFKKYFSNQPQLYKEYSAVLNDIYTVNPAKIGLSLNDWEYPLLNSFYYDHIKIVAVNVNNSTKDIPQNIDNIDVIISSSNSQDIVYNGITYINQNNNHSYIWFYKKSI